MANSLFVARILGKSKSCNTGFDPHDAGTRDIALLFIHLLATIARFIRPGGARSVVAESLLLKQQLSILNRSRERAPVSVLLTE